MDNTFSIFKNLIRRREAPVPGVPTSTKDQPVEKLGYTIESYEHVYVYNEPDFKDGYYITMLLHSKELEDWRDMMYRGYSHSDECRLEHQMECRAEIQFEDMVMGTSNM